jgi:4-amino-4-deoxy-L-arabinose transferase-like glycosyltransferase
LLAGIAIFLPGLGQEMSVSNSEANHAEIARNMAATGNYLVPRLCGRPYIDKPPLFNWCVAAIFRLSGRVDFTTARIPSVICAIVAMIAIYILGSRWFSMRAGIYAALIWATSWLVVEWGRLSQMDMMHACFILCAVLLADIAAAQERAGRQIVAWLGACGMIAAATMCKSPAAVFYFFICTACVWRARRGCWLPPAALLLLAVALTIAICAAWSVMAEMRDSGHMRQLLTYQFGEGLTEHRARITLYLDQLLLRSAPWGIFSVGAVYWAIRRAKRRGYDIAAAPALFLLVSLTIMTLTPNKREHYLLPLLPMWSLFIGSFLDHMLALRQGGGRDDSAEQVPRWMFEWPVRSLLVAGIAGAGSLAVYWIFSTRKDLAAGITLCAALALLAAWGASAAWRARNDRTLAVLFSICVLAMATAYPLTLKALNPPMEERLAARQVEQSVPAGVPLADFDVRNPYLSFKLNRPVNFINSPKELAAFLNQPGRRYLLSSKPSLMSLNAMTRRQIRQVEKVTIESHFVTVWEVG